jgi:hypothetical protein
LVDWRRDREEKHISISQLTIICDDEKNEADKTQFLPEGDATVKQTTTIDSEQKKSEKFAMSITAHEEKVLEQDRMAI